MITTNFKKRNSFVYNGEVMDLGSSSIDSTVRCEAYSSIAGAVIGSAGSIWAGLEQADSEKQAQQRNFDLYNQWVNQLRLDYNNSRGANGNAFMPLYLQDANGVPLEQTMGSDAVRAYNATSDMSSPQALEQMQALVGQTDAAQRGAIGQTNDLFNGRMADRMVANNQPMYAARTGVATATKNAKLEALKQTLNSIKESSARKGFSGDSSGSRMLEFGARRDANASGAIDMAQANLANTADTANIRNTNEQVKLANVNLPNQMAQNTMARYYMPQTQLLNNQMARQNATNFFRIGTDRFQTPAPPTYYPIPSTGQILGQAMEQSGYALAGSGMNMGGGGGGGGGGMSSGGGGNMAIIGQGIRAGGF